MKGYIYKISIKDKPELFYIGSTNNLSSRKSHHKKNVTNKVGKRYWTKIYLEIRQNGGWNNIIFEIIIKYDEINSDVLKQNEQLYLDELKPPLNSIKSYKDKRPIPLSNTLVPGLNTQEIIT